MLRWWTGHGHTEDTLGLAFSLWRPRLLDHNIKQQMALSLPKHVADFVDFCSTDNAQVPEVDSSPGSRDTEKTQIDMVLLTVTSHLRRGWRSWRLQGL